MGETHAEIRRLQRVTGKGIVAYLNQMACSAAYHVASACSEIWMPAEGVAGSVGVILCTVDETAALEKAGVAVRYVVTGKRKADLHPGQPVTDDVIKVAQEKVDLLGSMFFNAVGSARGISASRVEGYQAGVFVGQQAKDARLVDEIGSWGQFLALVRKATPDAPTKDPIAVARGRAGGKARAEKLGPRARSKIAKMGAAARWKAHA